MFRLGSDISYYSIFPPEMSFSISTLLTRNCVSILEIAIFVPESSIGLSLIEAEVRQDSPQENPHQG